MTEKTKHILLVEDDLAIVDVYQIVFKKAHLDLLSAVSGKQAIQSLEASDSPKPDLVLLDLTLPDMDGVDVLKMVKTKEATKDVPVFLLTNQAEGEIQQKLQGLELKPEKYIIKAHITPSQLVDVVKEYLGIA